MNLHMSDAYRVSLTARHKALCSLPELYAYTILSAYITNNEFMCVCVCVLCMCLYICIYLNVALFYLDNII